MNPADAPTRFNYGQFYNDIGEYGLGLEQFAKALELAPDMSLCYRQCGVCHTFLNQNAKAEELLLKAIELEPDNAQHHSEYAVFMGSNMKMLDVAKEHFEKAIKLDPDEGAIYFDYGKLCRDYLRDYKLAEKLFLKCIEINDLYITRMNGDYAYLLYLMGRLDDAKMYMDVQMDRMNLATYYGRIWTHFYNGLIYRGSTKESLEKAVESTNTKPLYEYVMIRLKDIKVNDVANVDYYDKFENLLIAEFK